MFSHPNVVSAGVLCASRRVFVLNATLGTDCDTREPTDTAKRSFREAWCMRRIPADVAKPDATGCDVPLGVGDSHRGIPSVTSLKRRTPRKAERDYKNDK